MSGTRKNRYQRNNNYKHADARAKPLIPLLFISFITINSMEYNELEKLLLENINPTNVISTTEVQNLENISQARYHTHLSSPFAQVQLNRQKRRGFLSPLIQHRKKAKKRNQSKKINKELLEKSVAMPLEQHSCIVKNCTEILPSAGDWLRHLISHEIYECPSSDCSFVSLNMDDFLNHVKQTQQKKSA